MAIRWSYVTNHPTGTNYCVGMTSDDSNTEIPESKNLLDKFDVAWTADDPALESPAIQNLVPQKRYNIAQNRIFECNAAQIAALVLQEAKAEKNGRVDRKTMRLFNKGVTYDSQVFPLSVDDFVNYLERYEHRNSLVSYPYVIIQRNRDEYSFANANDLKDFGEAAFTRRDVIVDGARDLKKLIHDAADLAAVNAIVDSRT